MATWYVHRRADNTIASAHQERQPGYADEALDDQGVELKAWLASAQADPSSPDSLAKAITAVLIASAALSGKTLAQARQAFTAAWKSLP